MAECLRQRERMESKGTSSVVGDNRIDALAREIRITEDPATDAAKVIKKDSVYIDQEWEERIFMTCFF